MGKRIAVVGAGPSGLAAVKELLAEGHEPIAFEKGPGLGGVFRYGEKEGDGVVWESCRLTSSGLLTAFSDFPAGPERAGHLTVREYVAYLTEYATAFGVDRCLRFGTTVESVARHPDGGWSVRVREAHGAREERVDAVAVCAGLHQYAHRPTFPGLDAFDGEVRHAAWYRRPAQVAGRRVLVVGAGESGADVLAEVSEHASETVLSLRRGVAVLPRLIGGKPNDYLTTRLGNASALWVFQTRNPLDDGKRRAYRAAFLPLVLLDKLLQVLERAVTAAGESADARAVRRARAALLAESGGTLGEQFGTKSDDFVRALVAGRCRRATAIARFERTGVVFEDGGRFEPDLVILCTGFETRVPFLDPALVAEPRYLHTFAPSAGPDLAFLGFLRPAFGAIPPLAELQARWFALVQSGTRTLPSPDSMREGIERISRFHAHLFRPLRGRLEALVDHTSFCDALAEEIGCKPTATALRKESAAFRRRFHAGPFVAAQYRLVGPHARPEIARAVISALPIAHPPLALANLVLRRSLSRTLHRLLGSEYAPKLSLSP